MTVDPLLGPGGSHGMKLFYEKGCRRIHSFISYILGALDINMTPSSCSLLTTKYFAICEGMELTENWFRHIYCQGRYTGQPKWRHNHSSVVPLRLQQTSPSCYTQDIRWRFTALIIHLPADLCSSIHTILCVMWWDSAVCCGVITAQNKLHKLKHLTLPEKGI